MSYTHYISIDFGTSGCAIALGLDKPDPQQIRVFAAWNAGRMGVVLKHPTILLANPNGEFEKFGEEALRTYKRLKDKANDYYLFHRFKMNLYNRPVSISDSLQALTDPL